MSNGSRTKFGNIIPKSLKKYIQAAKEYRYSVLDISEGNEIGYEAVVPKFPGMLILDDNVERLHEVVQIFIAEELEHLEKERKPIPKPDKNSNYSGRFILRVEPVTHERLATLAQASGTSLNQYVKDLIKNKIE